MRILMVLLMAVFFIAGPAIAEESVCDGEVGAAFGLCNAYCEAMDCDSDDVQASDRACDKVYNKFVNITGVEMPCEIPGQIDYSYLDEMFPNGCQEQNADPQVPGIPVCGVDCVTAQIPGLDFCGDDNSGEILTCSASGVPGIGVCGVDCQIVPDGYEPTTWILPVCQIGF